MGPAHRATPLGALSIVPRGELFDAARRQARLTHWHPMAGWVAAAVALLVRRLVEGKDIDGAPEATAWDAEQAALEGYRHAAAVAEILGTALTRKLAVEKAEAGAYAQRTLGAALAFVTRYDTFDAALKRAIAFAGAANYAPVLVGALVGAREGASAIPEGMLGHERETAREFRRLVALAGPPK